MLLKSPNLIEQFDEVTNSLNVSNEATRAYITGIFNGYVASTHNDLSKISLTIKYAEAKSEYNFEKFQLIGDWIFFSRSLFPSSLKNASISYYDALAQNSYYRCYKILDRKWLVFEELADEFQYLVETILESDLIISL